MKIFEHFPDDQTCLICNTNEDKECALIEVDGTSDGRICELIPIHIECIRKGDMRFNREANILYMKVYV